MSLAPCPDCGNECSTLAKACPKCGQPFESADSRHSESEPSAEATHSRSESEKERAARERKERIAKIPVTSRILVPLKSPAVQNNSNTTIGCVIIVALFVALAIFCCSSGHGTNSRYQECVRQRSAAGLDTSPCAEWTNEK